MIVKTVVAWVLAIVVALFIVLNVLVLPWFLPLRAWDKWAKVLCRRLVRCFGLRVRVEGLEHWPAEGAILVANHVNLLDLFVLYGWLPGYFRGLEQKQHFSWPIWGWATKRLGNISLDQGGGGGAAGALMAAGKALASGTSLLIFPEGHRTRTGRLGPFFRGAFRLAQRCRAPLVPVVQSGSWQAFGQGKGQAVGGPLTLRVLPAWPYERAAALTDREFLAAVEDEFRQALGE